MTTTNTLDIAWTKDVDVAFERARETNRPLLADFNAAPA